MAEIVADGPRFREWLLSTDADLGRNALGDARERALNRWKAGSNPTIGMVDEFCVFLGLHLSQVPDEIWVEKPPPKMRKDKASFTPEERARAIERVLAGESRREVAESLECTPHTVSNWMRKFRPEET